jgi:hypothetical protein
LKYLKYYPFLKIILFCKYKKFSQKNKKCFFEYIYYKIKKF